MRSTVTSVPAHSVTCSVNVPVIAAPLIVDVIVNTVLASATVALPVIVQVAGFSVKPVGSAGDTAQFENSLIVGWMFASSKSVYIEYEEGSNSMAVGSRSAHVTGCTSTPYIVVADTSEMRRRYDWYGFALMRPWNTLYVLEVYDACETLRTSLNVLAVLIAPDSVNDMGPFVGYV